MGGNLADAAVSGAKDASGNIISTPTLERHMSLSLAPGSELSPVLDDVTAAYIRLLQRRDDERDNELAALRAEVAQMKQRMQQDATPAASRSGGGRGRQTPPPPPPPPPPQGRQNEGGQRGSVKDRLGFTPALGDAREIILYKQPTVSGTRRSRSHHDGTRTWDTESFTSTYSTGRAEFSRTTASHRSRDSARTRPHVSEHIGNIPIENIDDEHHSRRNGKGVRTDGANDENKTRRNKDKTVDGPHRTTTDLRDKLWRRDAEKASAKENKERDSKRSKTDEHGKPPRPGFERQLKDLGDEHPIL